MEVKVVQNQDWNEESEQQLLQYTRRLLGPSMKAKLVLTSPNGLIRDRSGKIRSVIGSKS
jgi:hypothetical protein